MGSAYCSNKPNFLFAKDQNEVSVILDETKIEYERKLAYLKQSTEKAKTAEEDKLAKLLEVFIGGLEEFQNSLKKIKLNRKALYLIERKLDLYYELDHDAEEIDIIKKKIEVLQCIENNKVA